MRIFHVISGFENGGVEMLLQRLIAAMPQGMECHIVAHAVPVPSCRARFEALGATVHLVPCRKHYFAHKRALTALFATYRPDAVHVHTTEWGGLALAAAKAAGVPMRIQHSHAARRAQNPFRGLLLRRLLLCAERNATHLVACGTEAARCSFSKRALALGSVTLLPNGIDTAAFAFDGAQRARTRAQLGLDEDTVAVGMVARFSRQKNHRAALRIFAAFQRQCPRAVLLLAGDGPLRAASERYAQKLLPARTVRFLGVCEDTAALYAAMDCFLLPSRFEGMPITLVEAQASGLRCVVSDTVTREANFSGNVCFLPVGKPALWVTALGAPTPTREGAAALTAASGFALADTLKTLLRLYGLADEEGGSAV